MPRWDSQPQIRINLVSERLCFLHFLGFARFVGRLCKGFVWALFRLCLQKVTRLFFYRKPIVFYIVGALFVLLKNVKIMRMFFQIEFDLCFVWKLLGARWEGWPQTKQVLDVCRLPPSSLMRCWNRPSIIDMCNFKWTAPARPGLAPA